MAGKNLDKEFEKYADIVEDSYKSGFRTRQEHIRVERWMRKLRYPAILPAFKQIRNSHVKRLAYLTSVGIMDPPFNTMPPDSSLPKLEVSSIAPSVAPPPWVVVGPGNPHGTSIVRDDARPEEWQVTSTPHVRPSTAAPRSGTVCRLYSRKAFATTAAPRVPRTAPVKRERKPLEKKEGVIKDIEKVQEEVKKPENDEKGTRLEVIKHINELKDEITRYKEMNEKHKEELRKHKKWVSELREREKQLQIQIDLQRKEIERLLVVEVQVDEQQIQMQQLESRVSALSSIEPELQQCKEAQRTDREQFEQQLNTKDEQLKSAESRLEEEASREMELLKIVSQQRVLLSNMEQKSDTPQVEKEEPRQNKTDEFVRRDSSSAEAIMSLISSELETSPDIQAKPVSRQQLDVIEELADTEATYVRHLEYLYSGYLAHIQSGLIGDIPASDLESVSVNAEKILRMGKDFYRALSMSMSRPDVDSRLFGVVDALLAFTSGLSVYSEYISVLDTAMESITRLSTDSEVFKSFVDLRQREIVGINDETGTESSEGSIVQLISAPALRVTRYGVLIGRLLNLIGDEKMHDTLFEIQNKFETISRQVGRSKTHMDRQRQLVLIQGKMTGSPIKIAVPHRILVREGTMKLSTPGEVPVQFHFFLFNDLLMFSSARGATFKYRGHIPLHSAVVQDMPAEDAAHEGGFALTSSMGSSIYLISGYETVGDGNRWRSEISNFIDGLRGAVPPSWSLSRSESRMSEQDVSI